MMKQAKLLAILAALAMAVAPAAFAQNTNLLRVKLDGFRSNKGKARCALFNDSDPSAFPKKTEKALRPDHPGTIGNAYSEIDFTGIPTGKYALVCYHDENDNGKFDESILGMPKEGYCFSNNVKPTISAPKFNDCAFDYKGGDQSISITMIY